MKKASLESIIKTVKDWVLNLSFFFLFYSLSLQINLGKKDKLQINRKNKILIFRE